MPWGDFKNTAIAGPASSLVVDVETNDSEVDAQIVKKSEITWLTESDNMDWIVDDKMRKDQIPEFLFRIIADVTGVSVLACKKWLSGYISKIQNGKGQIVVRV